MLRPLCTAFEASAQVYQESLLFAGSQAWCSTFTETVEMGLHVECITQFIDQLKLCLKEVDVPFLVGHQLFEQHARRVVVD